MHYQDIKQAIDYYDKNKPWYRRIFGDSKDMKRLRTFFNDLAPPPPGPVYSKKKKDSDSVALTDLPDRELSHGEARRLRKTLKATSTIGSTSYRTYEQLSQALEAEDKTKDKTKKVRFKSPVISDQSNRYYYFLDGVLKDYDKNKSVFRRLFGDPINIRRLRKHFQRLKLDAISGDQEYELACLIEDQKGKIRAQLVAKPLYDGLRFLSQSMRTLDPSKRTSEFFQFYKLFVTYWQTQNDFSYQMGNQGNELYDNLFKLYKQLTKNKLLQADFIPPFIESITKNKDGYIVRKLDRLRLIIFLKNHGLLDKKQIDFIEKVRDPSNLLSECKNLAERKVPKQFWPLIIDLYKDPEHSGVSDGRYLAELLNGNQQHHKDIFKLLSKAKGNKRVEMIATLRDYFKTGLHMTDAGRANLDALSTCCQLNTYNLAFMMTNFGHLNQPIFDDEVLFSQANFDNLIRYKHIWCYGEVYVLLRQIPAHLFTQDLFDRLVTCCSRNTDPDFFNQPYNPDQLPFNLGNPQPEPGTGEATMGEMYRIIQQAIPAQDVRVDAAPELNLAQSIHEVSVHKSISKSVVKLKKRYGKQIDSPEKLQAVLQQIKEWAGVDKEQDGDDVKNKADAARRAVKHIIDTDLGNFKDERSGKTTTREALALVWLGLHDREVCTATEEDALKRFQQCLYEVQRGYNFDSKGVDKDGEDKPICYGGTFNKVIETLWGIHPEVKLKFLTKELAALKFKVIIRELTKEYLSKLSPKEQQDIIQLWDVKTPSDDEIAQYQAAEKIWNQIKDTASNLLIEEGYLIAFNTKEEFYTQIAYGVGVLDQKDSDTDKFLLDDLLAPYRAKKTELKEKKEKSKDKKEQLKMPPSSKPALETRESSENLEASSSTSSALSKSASRHALFQPAAPQTETEIKLPEFRATELSAPPFAAFALVTLHRHYYKDTVQPAQTFEVITAWLNSLTPTPTAALSAINFLSTCESENVTLLKQLVTNIWSAMYDIENINTALSPENRMRHLHKLVNGLSACERENLMDTNPDNVKKALQKITDAVWPVFTKPDLTDAATVHFNQQLDKLIDSACAAYYSQLGDDDELKKELAHKVAAGNGIDLIWEKLAPAIETALKKNGYLAVHANDEDKFKQAIADRCKLTFTAKLRDLLADQAPRPS